jgi:CRISPR/Cas system CSM-associated protein Csm3 (group 7 of RAMP superfamily)
MSQAQTEIDATEREEVQTIGARETITGEATARSPIHTGGNESAGNMQLFRRQSVYSPERDELTEVPFIHGNSVRGHLRRLLMRDMVERLDYTVRDERLYHSLFGGGMLQKDGKAEIDAGIRRRVRRDVPPLDLLGTSIGNQMFSGTVEVGMLYPRVAELNFRNRESVDRGLNDFIGDDFGTRMDQTPDDLGLSDVAFDRDADGEGQGSDDDQSQQQIFELETIVAGTQFEHTFTLKSHASRVGRACLVHGIDLWTDEARIGGWAAAGLGELALDYDVDLDAAEPYLDHLAENRDQIVATLDDLSRK